MLHVGCDLRANRARPAEGGVRSLVFPVTGKRPNGYPLPPSVLLSLKREGRGQGEGRGFSISDLRFWIGETPLASATPLRRPHIRVCEQVIEDENEGRERRTRTRKGASHYFCVNSHAPRSGFPSRGCLRMSGPASGSDRPWSMAFVAAAVSARLPAAGSTK